ncbi:hypothetical protein SDC9_79290 [bioreactor metagenome]|uniref:Contractile injection system tube protein N-terminal domain-containing protein n=1 Tax=bioreactor metagenome TaxID=1076179 RepID=A0A644YVW0_9ZZZZ
MLNALAGKGKELLGNPKKAFLILHKSTAQELSSEEIAKKTEQALSSATGLLANVSSKMGGDFHVPQVQYNPASIRFQANAESIATQYLQKNVDSSVPNQNTRPPAVMMSVDLIFDAVNLKDAFMLEKLRLSVGDAVSAVAALSKKNGYTVQPQTNGLIGMLMRESTRTVTFRWADMTFTGEVTEVSARYTMFSVSGKPVRSVVSVNITQQVESKSDLKYWDKAFDTAFGNADAAATTGGRGAGAAGNLLNINF